MNLMIFVDDVRRRDLEQQFETPILEVVQGPQPEDRCLECSEMRQYYGHESQYEGKQAGWNRHGTLYGHPFVEQSA